MRLVELDVHVQFNQPQDFCRVFPVAVQNFHGHRGRFESCLVPVCKLLHSSNFHHFQLPSLRSPRLPARHLVRRGFNEGGSFNEGGLGAP